MKILVIIIVALLGLISIVTLLLVPSQQISMQQNIPDINKSVVGEQQINLILYSLKAYELHNPPLSGNTPKIEFVIDGEIYGSEIVKGEIITVKGRKGEPDIRIIMSGEEFLNILKSDSKLYFQESLKQGKTKIELLAGKTELFTKGYLSLYKEITGKNFPV